MVFGLDLLSILDNDGYNWDICFCGYLGGFCFEFFEFEVMVDGGFWVDFD